MATRARGGGGSVTVPKRTQIRPGTPVDNEGSVKCSGHNRRCPRLIAGPSSKNPGRAFYACPLPRDDPSKCKFFLWEDEMDAKTPHKENGQSKPTKTPQTQILGGRTLGAPPQPLGQSPSTRYGKPTVLPSPSVNRTAVRQQTRDKSDEIDELDWDNVDAERMEREAIASTPSSSQKTETSHSLPSTTLGGSSFHDRLKAVNTNGGAKRTHDDEEKTPKKVKMDDENPFLASPSITRTPSHPVLSPALASLEQVSEHIQRQDRLLNAAEQMKQGLRKTINNLQEENKALKERIKELETKSA